VLAMLFWDQPQLSTVTGTGTGTGTGKKPSALANLARNLRLANDERQRLEWLHQHARSLNATPGQRLSQYQRLLTHPGIFELITLHQLTGAEAKTGADFVSALIDKPDETWNPQPLITGHDLQELNIPPGPRFKELLDQVRNMQLDGLLQTHTQTMAYVQTQHPY
jgi:poly(A) polymerase